MDKLPAYSDLKTSMEAAERIMPHVTPMQAECLQDIIGSSKDQGGLTCAEVESRWKSRGKKGKHQTVSPRLNELVNLGILVHTDVRRNGSRIYVLDPDLNEKDALKSIEEEKAKKKKGPVDIGSFDPKKPSTFCKLGVPGEPWIRVGLSVWEEVAQMLKTQSDEMDHHALADAMLELFDRQRLNQETSRKLDKDDTDIDYDEILSLDL